MADLDRNKQTVIAFITRAFNHKQPADAVAKYVGSAYIRVIAEGDLVVAHLLINMAPENRGMAGVDIFRLQDGKIVEHWDVLQPVPERAANNNTMF